MPHAWHEGGELQNIRRRDLRTSQEHQQRSRFEQDTGAAHPRDLAVITAQVPGDHTPCELVQPNVAQQQALNQPKVLLRSQLVNSTRGSMQWKADRHLPAALKKAAVRATAMRGAHGAASEPPSILRVSANPQVTSGDDWRLLSAGSRWLQLLYSTMQRVKGLQEKLARFAFPSSAYPSDDAQIVGDAERSELRLEAVLIELAGALRNGPPGGTAAGTAYLLDFLQQQQGRTLRPTKVRRLLKRVRHSLRRAAMSTRSKGCYRHSYSTAACSTGSLHACNRCYSKRPSHHHRTHSSELQGGEPHVSPGCSVETLGKRCRPHPVAADAAPVTRGTTAGPAHPGYGASTVNELRWPVNVERLQPTQRPPPEPGVRYLPFNGGQERPIAQQPLLNQTIRREQHR